MPQTAAPLISDEYRALNRRVHEGDPSWGGSGGRFAPLVARLAERLGTWDILDYGCGKGSLAAALGREIHGYDPAVPALAAAPNPAAIVTCFDVLEHVEPDCIDAVLDHLAELTLQFGFFVVATRPAIKVLPDGRNAHLIQAPAAWWTAQIGRRFKIVQAEDVGGRECAYLVARRPR
ncbi:MAG: hypothetical protein KBD01_03320 [Acidobacteria bacterium]|nr:hypothetical protein [Acidobacteriota bacterium]